MHEWWRADPSEHYWIEVTDRDDVGADLNAPVVKDTGQPFWSYDLLMNVDDGDVIFHFHKPSKAIVGYSYASGEWWSDQVIWGAQGTSARKAGTQPYPRPGRRLGLHHLTPLVPVVSLATIRANAADVLALRERLAEATRAATYFPFVPYPGEGVRPSQGYLFKFPKDLLTVLGLAPVDRHNPANVTPENERGVATVAIEAAAVHGGEAYRRALESTAVSYADPLPRDPALIERALAAHAVTQNELADHVQAAGLVPLSPAPDDPDWDLAFWDGSTFVVAEVKSLSRTNEERQLRLGLGQLLRYRHHLAAHHPSVRAVLVTERRPVDHAWLAVCDSVGVDLCWRGSLPDLTEAHRPPPDPQSEAHA